MAKEIQHPGCPQEQGSYLSLNQQRATDTSSASASEAPTSMAACPPPAPAQVPLGGCKTCGILTVQGHHWHPCSSLFCLSQNKVLKHCHWGAASCEAIQLPLPSLVFIVFLIRTSL